MNPEISSGTKWTLEEPTVYSLWREAQKTLQIPRYRQDVSEQKVPGTRI